jgi:hypothetical protein
VSNSTRISRKAIASLVMGILTLFIGLWTGGSQSLPVLVLCVGFFLVALAVGILARRDVAKSAGELQGKNLAVWGIGLSIAGPILGLVLASTG